MEVTMARIPASKVREGFSDTLNRVAYGRERVILHRRGKDVAAVVPMEDLKLIEAIEDRMDLEDARKALAGMKRKGHKPIPWEKLKAQLGL
jgi:prevent-host-death family protein